MLECAKVCGVRQIGDKMRKGSERWSTRVSVAIAEKRRAYKVWLQKKGEASYVQRNQAGRVVGNGDADERCGRKLTSHDREIYEEVKFIMNEVRKIWEGLGDEEHV